MRVFLLRHAPTAWNHERKIQGKADIPLSQTAQTALDKLILPKPWLKLKWISSPLQRARDTARLLGASEYEIHQALSEMDWGQFEGLRLSEINHQIEILSLQPDRGLDLLPPGGESPRMVRARVAEWLKQLPLKRVATIAVTHKGVIRAALSLATGWDMQHSFSEKIHWHLPLAFELTETGSFELIRVNCAWEDTDILEGAGVSC